MHRIIKRIALSIFCLLFFCKIINAQGSLIRQHKFRNFTTDDGLNHQVIRDIIQDKHGFIWIATTNGLNRFDGTTFNRFINEPDNPNSLGNNNIFEIEEDGNGNLWIATLRGGLDLFDPIHNKFYHYKHSSTDQNSILSDEIVSLLCTADHKLWGGTRFGIFETSIAAEASKAFLNYHFSSDSTALKYAYDIVEMAEHQLWLASRDGLFLKTKSETAFQKILPTEEQQFNIFHKFLKFDEQTFWGTFLINRIADLSPLTQHPAFGEILDLTDSLSLTGNHKIYDILLTDSDLWIATGGGLFQYPGFKKGQTFPKPIVHKESKNPMSLGSSVITCLYEDRDNNVWIGTSDGLNLYHRDYQFFNHQAYHSAAFPKEVIRDYRFFMVDKNKHLWVCTDFGVHIFKNEKKQWIEIKQFPISEFKAKEAVKLLEDENGAMWLMAYGSLSKITHNNYDDFLIKSYTFNHKMRGVASTEILTQIKMGADKKIYLSAYRGILQFDPKTELFELFSAPEAMYLTDLIYIEEKKQWLVGSQLGLLSLDTNKKELTYFLNEDGTKVIENDRIKCILLEGDSLLWVGGGNGLHKIDLKTNRRKTYHLNDGLKDVFIINIFHDRQKNIWLTNSQGLAVLDRKNNYFFNFGIKDGIQSPVYTTRSAFIENNGKVWLVGNEGVNAFFPDEIYKIATEDKGKITAITINNEQNPVVSAEKLDARFDLVPFAVDHLKLNHKDSWLTLSYAPLNFTHPEKINHEYRLNTDNQQWTPLLPGQPITYTNLPSGTHQLYIRSKVNNQTFRNEKVLTFEKKPSPWKSTPAYFSYVLFLGLLVWAWIKNRERQFKRDNALIERERESFRKRSARDFHDEAGHHITKISILSELVNRTAEGDSQLHDYAAQISSTVQKLRFGMRDFIWVLDPENDNLFNTVARIKAIGNQLFEHNKTSFQCTPNQESWKNIDLDSEQRRHLLFIFKEAMNNSLKYAAADTVSFIVAQNNKSLALTLSDDGVGFEKNADQKNGYGLKNMKARAKKIKANFEINTSPQKGSTIHISLFTSG